MKKDEYKIKKKIPSNQVASFLRALADVAESELSGESTSGELGELINNYLKISLEIKRKSDQVNLRMKVKKSEMSQLKKSMPSVQPNLAENNEKPDYKSLKKEMQSTFNAILRSLNENRLPPHDLVRQFCDESKLMVSYSGKGDSDYPAYTHAVNEFMVAFESKDYLRFKTMVETLEQLKKEYHNKYK